MSHNPAIEIASTIQAAHIKRDPSPTHDVNPSTAASTRVPVDIPSPELSEAEDDESTIPSDIVRPSRRPRRKSFPPLPDMRFEQSYLASLKNAETNTQVAIITIRDQVLLPLVQGVLWNFVLFGWRHFNRGTKFQGETIGAKVRKWWWGVNNWKLPKGAARDDFTRTAEDFYVNRFGSSLGD
jgi:hypothetical protein